jgi:hypothetical protein
MDKLFCVGDRVQVYSSKDKFEVIRIDPGVVKLRALSGYSTWYYASAVTRIFKQDKNKKCRRK